MVLRSVIDQAIQAHLQGKPHKKRMQDNDPGQDYECDCGRKLERVKAFQIKQHRESPACREARLHILSPNFMAERVQVVPSDFAFEESNPPPVAEVDPCVGPADAVMVEVDDAGFATCPGFCSKQLTPETFCKLYPFAIHTTGGIPNCPPISWLLGQNVVFSVVCDGTRHNGEKCCEHCAELKDSEALKKVLDCRKWHCTYAMSHHMAQAHTGVSHDYAGCSEQEKTKVLQAFDNFRAPLPPKAKPAAPPALPTVLPALLSRPNQGSSSSSGNSGSSCCTTNASCSTSASSGNSAPSGPSDYVPSESMSDGPAAFKVTRSQAAGPKKRARPKSTGKRARDEWEDDSAA